MPSQIERVIARNRAQLDAKDAQASARMRAIYTRQAEAIMRDLALITRKIEDARAQGIEVHPDWLRRQSSYVRLIYQVDALYAGLRDDGMHLLQDLAIDAGQLGAEAGQERLNAVGITVDVGFQPNINVPATERLAMSLVPESPVRAILDGYGELGRNVIIEELIDGMALGRSPREIIRRARNRIDQETGPRLDALVRTEMMRSYRGALFDQYGDHVGEWSWSAAHGPRTCLACLAMDGQRFPMTQRFMQAHPNCRCSPSPVPRKLYGPPIETGEEWLARQDAATQRRMMPTEAAYQAYRDGKVQLSDFVGMRHDRVWGPSVYERSGRQVLREARR